MYTHWFAIACRHVNSVEDFVDYAPFEVCKLCQKAFIIPVLACLIHYTYFYEVSVDIVSGVANLVYYVAFSFSMLFQLSNINGQQYLLNHYSVYKDIRFSYKSRNNKINGTSLMSWSYQYLWFMMCLVFEQSNR